jgi:hypothetical protein
VLALLGECGAGVDELLDVAPEARSEPERAWLGKLCFNVQRRSKRERENAHTIKNAGRRYDFKDFCNPCGISVKMLHVHFVDAALCREKRM